MFIDEPETRVACNFNCLSENAGLLKLTGSLNVVGNGARWESLLLHRLVAAADVSDLLPSRNLCWFECRCLKTSTLANSIRVSDVT